MSLPNILDAILLLPTVHVLRDVALAVGGELLWRQDLSDVIDAREARRLPILSGRSERENGWLC